MVGKKSPPSLEDLSISRVACSLLNVQPDGVQEATGYLQLPPHFTNELLQQLRDNYYLGTGQLLLLLRIGLQKIELTKGNVDVDMSQVMQFDTGLLKNVFHVSFDKLQHLTTIVHIPSRFPHLRELHIPRTSCNDSFMKVVSECFPHLRSLDLTQCPITNVTFTKELKNSTLTKTLERIFIRGTLVTCFGASDILEDFVALQELAFDGTIELFYAKHKCLRTSTYNLQTIILNNIPLRRRANEKGYVLTGSAYLNCIPLCLKFIGRTCPTLQKISIVCSADFVKDSMTYLRDTEHLMHVEVRCMSNRRRIESSFISPLLDGNHILRLQELVVSGVANLNIAAIGKTVLNLRTLLLDNVRNVIVDKQPYSFPMLRKLAVGKADDGLLKEILSHADHVEELSIFRMYEFSDSFIIKLEEKFHRLHLLSVACCVNVTHRGLLGLINSDSRLEELNIFMCLHVNLGRLRCSIKRGNYDVRLTTHNGANLFRGIYEEYDSYTFPRF